MVELKLSPLEREIMGLLRASRYQEVRYIVAALPAYPEPDIRACLGSLKEKGLVVGVYNPQREKEIVATEAGLKHLSSLN